MFHGGQVDSGRQVREVTLADFLRGAAWVRVGWSLQYYHNFTWFGLPVLQLPEDLLASDRIYQWVRPGFGQTGNNFYLNLDAVLTAYEQMLPSTDALDMISPIRGVGI